MLTRDREAPESSTRIALRISSRVQATHHDACAVEKVDSSFRFENVTSRLVRELEENADGPSQRSPRASRRPWELEDLGALRPLRFAGAATLRGTADADAPHTEWFRQMTVAETSLGRAPGARQSPLLRSQERSGPIANRWRWQETAEHKRRPNALGRNHVPQIRPKAQ